MSGTLPPRLVGYLLIPVLLVTALVAGLMRPVPAAEPRDPALAAYLAMGGDPADICGQGGRAHGSRHCDACRLIGPALMPGPSGGWQPVARAVAFRRPEPPRTRIAAMARYRTSTPRAPPPLPA